MTLSETRAWLRWRAGLLAENLRGLRDRARERLPSAPTLPTINISSGGRSIGAVVLVALLWIGSLYLVAWRSESARDDHWRSEIARKSAAVTEILRTAGHELPAADAADIARLEQENANDVAEIERLKAARGETPLSDACRACRIPRERVRKR